MARFLAFTFLVLLVTTHVFGSSTARAQAFNGGPVKLETAKKKCTKSDVGNEGCDITLEWRISPNSPCSPGCPEYCVKVIVKCPEGTPAGDPGDECESAENCEICCNFGSNTTVSVTCDGQDFTVGPKSGKNWGDALSDCGDLEFSAG